MTITQQDLTRERQDLDDDDDVGMGLLRRLFVRFLTKLAETDA